MERIRQGKVSWTSFKLKYKGTAYTVAADSAGSANAYFYWDISAPTVITTTATKSATIGVGKFFVGWNNAGTFSPTNFQKIITAGHVSVTSLAALGITVVNADIGNLAVKAANIDNLAVTNAQIANLTIGPGQLASLAAQTAKIANSATKIWNSAAGSSVAHTTAGGSIELLGSVTFTGTSPSGGNATVTMKYDGTTVASGTVSANAGQSNTLQLTSVDTGSGTLAMSSSVYSGSGTVSYDYVRSMEDKGK
jgi:hypothetical protein